MVMTITDVGRSKVSDWPVNWLAVDRGLTDGLTALWPMVDHSLTDSLAGFSTKIYLKNIL